MPLADRVMRARGESTCPICRRRIRVGQQIARCGGVWQHVGHVIESLAAQHREAIREENPMTTVIETTTTTTPVTDDEHGELLTNAFDAQREAEEHLDQAAGADWGHGVPQAATDAYRRAAWCLRRAAALLDRLAAQPTAHATVTTIRRAPMGPRGAA